MIVVRHGLMTVGQPFSGKSKSMQVLAGALTDLNEQGIKGTLFNKIQVCGGAIDPGGGGAVCGGQ